MSTENEQRAAMRILDGIEQGTMTTAESFAVVEDADPALIYLIFTWLRKRYAGDANDAVIARLADLSNRYPAVAAKMKEGKADSLVEWFEDAYSYRDLAAKDFIELVVDKMES